MVKKKILICPLDWGLGHASRIIPIINALIKNNFEIIIAADNYPLQLLKSEFPDLLTLKFPSYQISYSKGKSLVFKMLFYIPKIIFGIYKEHKRLNTIINEYKIDIVISDNRFGLWNKKITSIFITHQVMIKMPKYFKFFEYPVHLINKWFILKYNICWIPDFETMPNLSGDLSHKYELPNASFIGLLSRFSRTGNYNIEKTYDIVVILSGPEPQRTIFEKIVYNQAKLIDYKTLIIKGIPGKKIKTEQYENITLVSHLLSEEINNLILSTEIIICRSGYSSIMDLISLNKKAILVPTPGQTEQEYLAQYHSNNKYFYCVFQDKFNLENDIMNLKKYSQTVLENNDKSLLYKEINKLKI